MAVQLPKPLWFLMLVPPFRLSTAWVYEFYDRLGRKKEDPTPLRDSYPSLAALLPVLKNDLELVAFSRHPEIAQMKEGLLARGAPGALMSGSGPVLFGLFPGKEEAEKTRRAILLPAGWKMVIAQGI